MIQLLFLPAAAVLLLFRVPVLGRLLAQGVRIVAEVVAHLLNVPDIALRMVGVRLRKKLRLHVVILRDAGQTVLAKETLAAQLDTTRRVLDAAGIDLIVRGIYEDDRDAPPQILDVHSNVRAYLEDLRSPGCWFEAAAGRAAPGTAWRRLLGLGAPLFAVVVRSIKRGFIGCSLGIAADYVTASVAGTKIDPEVFVHEIGHALGLLHRRERDNLMWHYAGRGCALTTWQVTLMRGSRHVTFF